MSAREDVQGMTDDAARPNALAEPQDVPPGYKRTEVGVIPEDWDVYSLFQLAGESKARFDDGDWVEAEFLTDSGVRLIQTGNIGVGEFIEKDSRKYISDHSFDFLRCKDVYPGDLLICRLAAPAGRACIVPDLGERRMITSVDITIFRPVLEFAYSRFLLHIFGTRHWFADVSNRCGGSTRSRIARGQLAKIKVQVPPIHEQRAIAEALSDVDGLLGALEALIAKKRAIKQAAMQQLLTGKTRLPGFSGEWEMKRLGDHVKFLRKGTHSRADLAADGPVRYLHYGDIHTSTKVFLNVEKTAMPRLALHKATGLDRLEDGDLILVDASEDLIGIGKSVEVTGANGIEVVSGLHTIATRFDKSVFVDGFKAYLQFIPAFRQQLIRLAAGTKVYATNPAHVASVEICLPEPAEQRAIAAVLSDMDAEIEALEARRDKVRAIKQGMMQQLLTGRVRLVKPEVTSEC